MPAAAVVEDGEAVLPHRGEPNGDGWSHGGGDPELASREHLRALSFVGGVPTWATRSSPAAFRGLPLHRLGTGGLALGRPEFAATRVLEIRDRTSAYCLVPFEGHIHAVIMRPAGPRPSSFPSRLVVSCGHTTCSKSSKASATASWARPATTLPEKPSTRSAVSQFLSRRPHHRPHGSLLQPARCVSTFAKMKGNALDFSFSGIKTAVLRWGRRDPWTPTVTPGIWPWRCQPHC